MILDVRPAEMHNIFNFTEQNDNVKHIPLEELYTMSIEEVKGLLEIEEESKSKKIYFFIFFSFCVLQKRKCI